MASNDRTLRSFFRCAGGTDAAGMAFLKGFLNASFDAKKSGTDFDW